MQVGQLGAVADHPAGTCGFLNRTSPASRSGLIEMILAPFFLAISSADSIRGWLVPGFCPASDDQLGVVDVLDADAGLADADRLRQGDAGRLVAHVRAVGQVVGAERPGEELVGERRLVGGPTGGVEDRLVRAVQPAAVRRR